MPKRVAAEHVRHRQAVRHEWPILIQATSAVAFSSWGLHPSIFKTRRLEAVAGIGISTGSSAMAGTKAADAAPATNVLRSIVMPLFLLDLSLWDCGDLDW